MTYDSQGSDLTPAAKQKGVLTTGDVAVICKCSHDTVKRWLENHQLPGHRLTPQGQWRVLPRDLVDFMARRGLPMDEEARAILGLPEPPVKDFVYCWEFHGRNKTHVAIEGRNCRDCLAFKSTARDCFALRGRAGHQEVFCAGPCEECDYYRYVMEIEGPGVTPEA